MPVEWVVRDEGRPGPPGASCAPEGAHRAGDADAGRPLAELHLWPYRSLPRRGFVIFIGITCALVAVPLLAVLGSPVLWGLLPFFALTLWALWAALQRSYRDGEVLEELRLWHDRVALVRHNPRGPRQCWESNPYWVELALHETGGPVENYLTLRGSGREVELGAFLSPEERQGLYDDLHRQLARARG